MEEKIKTIWALYKKFPLGIRIAIAIIAATAVVLLSTACSTTIKTTIKCESPRDTIKMEYMQSGRIRK